MAEPCVKIVDTGTANLASMCAAFRRLESEPRITEYPVDVTDAAILVVPGVGSFGAAMRRLRALRMEDAIRQRVQEQKPTLFVCLGLQVLAAESEETPGCQGLGIVTERVTRFPAGQGLRVPQLGWNRVVADDGAKLLNTGYAYFANSYKLDVCPTGWTAAWGEHGNRFIAAIERGPLLACQFHPELSGPWGQALLRRWLDAALEKEAAAC